jgi:hypothetical protein
MTNDELYALKFPIGEFTCPEEIDAGQLRAWMTTISRFPANLIELTEGISEAQKNWRYRPGGWRVKQVVHHCADSHLNSVTRFKLALTEDNPTIRPYHEEKWAELRDSLEDNLSDSIEILSGLHAKWSWLLAGLSSDQLMRTYLHPDREQPFTLKEAIGLYAWHCDHHLGHIKLALKARGQYN